MSTDRPFYNYISQEFHGLKHDQGVRAFDRPVSHTLMDGVCGGQLFIAERDNQRFLDHYATYISTFCGTAYTRQMATYETHLYISEYRTPVFPFIYDLDFKQPADLEMKDELLIHHIIQQVTKSFFPDLAITTPYFDIVVTARPSSKLPDDRFKIGRHGYMPNLMVNEVMARRLREAIVLALEEKFPERDLATHNPWSDVVDERIYGPNGLRMTYSSKTEPCSQCKTGNSKRPRKERRIEVSEEKACGSCRGRGRVRSAYVYEPHLYVHNGENDEVRSNHFKNNITATVKITSIRKDSDTQVTPGFYVPNNFPAPVIFGNNSVEQKEGRLEFKEDAKVRHRYKNHVHCAPGSPEWKAIQYYIQNHMPDVWKEVRIKDVTYPTNLSCYHVLLKGPGSNYCVNIGANHRNNTVYFVFRPKGVIQKCHCQCDTLVGRRNGLCKKFSSQEFLLVKETKDVLFPKTFEYYGYLQSAKRSEKELQRNGRIKQITDILSTLRQLMEQKGGGAAKKRGRGSGGGSDYDEDED